MSPSATLIYIIDDDASIRRALGRVMTTAGFKIRSFATGEEFIDSGEFDPGGCVVTDAQLPGMSGLDVKHWINATHSGLPFIFLSAQDDEETRQSARDAGAVAYFRKPVDTDALLDSIRWVIRPPASTRQIAPVS
jgi:FixJ family two-component response regulator